MAQPVVHFEVIGQDPDKLRDYFGRLFGWEWAEPMGPQSYSTITNPDGVGGESAADPRVTRGT
jgi:uncharacterized protein